VRKTYLAEGNELGLPWERWSDGLPYRLKRKRDFGDIDPELVREAAKNAARRMGKVVKSKPDAMMPGNRSKYLWVQFADHEIRIGDPCKCGGLHLLRVHPFFARCTSCGAQLLLAPKGNAQADGLESADDDEDADDRPQPADVLRKLADVHLSQVERTGDRETYRGYCRLAKTPMLLIAQFRAEPGERLAADNAFDRVAAVQVLPLRQLGGLLDASALTDPGAEWDLIL
jgi:hypothetical protein